MRREVLVEEYGAAEGAVRQQRVSRHRADALPAAAFVKPLGFGTGSVEHQQGPAGFARGLFRGGQYGGAHAQASRTPVYQHLGDVGAMWLVFRRSPDGLGRAENGAAIVLRDHQRTGRPGQRSWIEV